MTATAPVRDQAEYNRLLMFYRTRVAEYDAPAEYADQWLALCRRILAHGGELVVPPFGVPEHQVAEFLDGDVQPYRARPTRGGRRNGCHENASLLWLTGRANAIGTGYALSDDGLWRQHSWGLTGVRVRTVLETTVARDAYYGIELTGADALDFAMQNATSVANAVLSKPRTDATAHVWDAVEALAAASRPVPSDDAARAWLA